MFGFDFTGMFSFLVGGAGLIAGASFALVLFLLGHGYASLIAIPAVPLSLVALVKLIFGKDA